MIKVRLCNKDESVTVTPLTPFNPRYKGKLRSKYLDRSNLSVLECFQINEMKKMYLRYTIKKIKMSSKIIILSKVQNIVRHLDLSFPSA